MVFQQLIIISFSCMSSPQANYIDFLPQIIALARVFRRRRDTYKAISLFTNIVQIKNSHIEASLQLAEIFHSRGESIFQKKYLQLILSFDNQNYRACYNLISIYQKEKNNSKMMDCIQKLLNHKCLNQEEFYKIGKKMLKQKNLQLSKKSLDKIVSNPNCEKKIRNEDLTEFTNDLGQQFMQKKQYQLAIECYKATSAISKGNSSFHFNYGLASYFGGDNVTAIDQFNTTIKLNPNGSSAYYNLGNIYSQQKDMMEKAQFYFAKAKQKDPKDSDTHYRLGNALIHRGANLQAVQELQLANKLQPNNMNVLFQLGLSHMRLWNVQTSLQYFYEVIKNEKIINHTKSCASLNIGYLLQISGKPEQALKLYRECLKTLELQAQIYLGLGLIAKNNPNMKDQCIQVLEFYELDKSNKIGVAFNICYFYQIAGDYKKTEKYFLKAIKIYDQQIKDSKDMSYFKQFLRLSVNHQQCIRLWLWDLVNKFMILKGIFLKYMNEKGTTQFFRQIIKDYDYGNKKYSSMIVEICSKQFSKYSAEAQVIFSDFLLCQMAKNDFRQAVNNFIVFNNINPEATPNFANESQFSHEYNKKRRSYIQMIVQAASVIRQFIQTTKIKSESESDLMINMKLIVHFLKQLEQFNKKYFSGYQQWKEMLIQIVRNYQKIILQSVPWSQIPLKSDCYFYIYVQITKIQAQMVQKNNQLKRIIVSMNYENLSTILGYVKIYLSQTYPLNVLCKIIYNNLAYLLIEDENKPKQLAQILRQIVISKDFDYRTLRAKLQNILSLNYRKQQSTYQDLFHQGIQKWRKKILSERGQQQIDNSNNIDQIQNMPLNPRLNIRRTSSGDNIRIRIQQNQPLQQQIQSFKDTESQVSQQMVSIVDESQSIPSAIVTQQDPITQKRQFNIKDVQFDKDCRQSYKQFRQLLISHICYIYTYVGKVKQKNLFSKPIVQNNVRNQDNQLQLLFSYQVLLGDPILSQDYSVQGDQRDVRILWGLTRKHLFSFIRCVAGSINELNKLNIFHKNICFKNIKKTKFDFKLVGLEETLFIPLQQQELQSVNYCKNGIIVYKKIGELQQKLNKNVRDMLNFYIRLEFLKNTEDYLLMEQEKSSSIRDKTNKTTLFTEYFDNDYIPSYLFGQLNYSFFKDFIKIKNQSKFELPQNKIDKCAKFLRYNYQRMHLRQFKRILQKLLKNKVNSEQRNAQKISKQQINNIFSNFQLLQEYKISYDQFIQNVEKIEKKEYIQLEKNQIKQQQEGEDYFFQSDQQGDDLSICMVQNNNTNIIGETQILYHFNIQQIQTKEYNSYLIQLKEQKCKQYQIFNRQRQLQQLNIQKCKFLVNSPVVNFEYFTRCYFIYESPKIVGLFNQSCKRIRSGQDILQLNSKRILYQFIISLTSFIEELQFHGFYSSCLDFNSIIQEKGIFKFIGLQNIYKMKQSIFAQKQDHRKKIDLQLLNISERIIIHLLSPFLQKIDVVKFSPINYKIENKDDYKKLAKITGDIDSKDIYKMVKRYHIDKNVLYVLNSVRKFMVKNHLTQFCKLVNKVLDLQITRIEKNNQNEDLSQKRYNQKENLSKDQIQQIRGYLLSLTENKSKNIDYGNFKRQLKLLQIRSIYKRQ